MAGNFTNYLSKKLLDLVFSNTAYSIPSTLYFGLSTTAPTDAGGNITEPVGNGYARKGVTNNSTNFPAATGSTAASKSNGAAITFDTATGSWGTVTHWFVADAATSGNVLAYGTLTASKTPGNTDAVTFAVGDWVFTLD